MWFVGISGDGSPAAVTHTTGEAEFRGGAHTMGMEMVDDLAGVDVKSLSHMHSFLLVFSSFRGHSHFNFDASLP